MSKRTESRRTAVFELEPDGFSIHTFELSRKLTRHEYQTIKDSLYRSQETSGRNEFYREYSGHYCCITFKDAGVRIYLEHNQNIDGFESYYVRLIVNPRKLIEPECSYLGILPPDLSSIEMLKSSFKKLLHRTIFEHDINAYYLSRVDLCTNIRCESNKLFRELIRVLRKLPTPPKYERKFYKHKDQKKANRYNKHYLRFCCGTHELVIYDKTYQIRNGNLVISYEKLPEGVLRFEVHCKRGYIQRIAKKYGAEDTLEQIRMLVEVSEDKIVKHFSQCFPAVAFAQTEELEQRIEKSSFSRKSKNMMLELVSRLQRTQSVDKALDTMEAKGFDTSGLLDRFTKLGLSPIPLRKKFCAQSLPGPVELLRDVSAGEITVEYIKAKYK